MSKIQGFLESKGNERGASHVDANAHLGKINEQKWPENPGKEER